MKSFHICTFHQRLNALHQDFCEWFVGFTEGDGCFFMYKNRSIWGVGFKIALHKSDIRTLIYIQQHLKCGKLSWANSNRTMIQYQIRRLDHFVQYIVPLFDSCLMFTNKYKDYVIVRKAALYLERRKHKKPKSFYLDKLAQELTNLRNSRKTTNSYLSCRLQTNDPYRYCENLGIATHLIYFFPNELAIFEREIQWGKLCQQSSTIMSIKWLVGFFEAEGSFYITEKEVGRYSHGFGISQKTPFILEVIKRKLRIIAKVQEKLIKDKSFMFFCLDNTNSRVNRKIAKLFKNQFVGLKSLQFRIWSRSLGYKQKHRLANVQKLLRSLTIN